MHIPRPEEIALKDKSLEDAENLPPPEDIAAQIVGDLEEALAHFRTVLESLMLPSTEKGPAE